MGLADGIAWEREIAEGKPTSEDLARAVKLDPLLDLELKLRRHVKDLTALKTEMESTLTWVREAIKRRVEDHPGELLALRDARVK